MFGPMVLPAAVVVLVLVPGAVALLVAVLRAGRPDGHDATVVAARRHEARISAAAAALSIGLAVGLGEPRGRRVGTSRRAARSGSVRRGADDLPGADRRGVALAAPDRRGPHRAARAARRAGPGRLAAA